MIQLQIIPERQKALMVMNSPKNHDQTRCKVINSFGTHTNSSLNILDDADTQPPSDTPAALSQIIAELAQISANQR